MWKEYSISHIKNNKTTSLSLMVAALVSALFLSLITSVFYNIWTDNISQIVKEEGDWQAKIIKSISEEGKERMKSAANVKKVVTKQGENGVETQLYFYERRSIYQDMPQIAKLANVEPSAIQYHDTLLSEYFVFSPEDQHPPMLLAFYVFVMAIACFSLILIIRNAFLLSMHSRLHQLGILQSIGATPGQIRRCLLQEALALCLLPIIIGIGSGVALCMGVMQLANEIVGTYQGENAVFSYHIGLFFLVFCVSILTVICSAWLPARKISKMTPLQVMKNEEAGNLQKEVRMSRLFLSVFGIEGELARTSLYARRKSLRTANLSLTLSFFAFSLFLCFITLSGISTKYTYFERYQDAWDIMATVKNKSIIDLEKQLDIKHRGLKEQVGIHSINEVESCILYQKALAFTWLTDDMMSNELRKVGGLSFLAGSDLVKKENKYQVKIPIVILDDESFQEYGKRVGVTAGTTKQGIITVNQIWDKLNSNYRHKKYIPFIKETKNISLTIYQDTEADQEVVTIAILGYTNQLPLLREEYANNSLVQVMSASTWGKLFGTMKTESLETYMNIQTINDDSIQSVQIQVEKMLQGQSYNIENRVEEEQFNVKIREGYTIVMGGLCGLLALIGLANVFSNTLGLIHQRKREFARYLSIGLSPKGIKKILGIEALILGCKPIVVTIPLTVVFVIYAATASDIDLLEFFHSAPVLPLLIFASMILGCVGLAYYLGGRKISKNPIVDTLKDDTLA